MKYEKASIEVVRFDDMLEFMAGSLIDGKCTGYADSHGHTCGVYSINPPSCATWTTPSWGGGTCDSYDGHKCRGYTDPSRTTPCNEYGLSCGTFV